MSRTMGLSPPAHRLRTEDASGLADLHVSSRPVAAGEPLLDRAAAGDRLLTLGRREAAGAPWLLLDSAGGLPGLAGPSTLLLDPVATFLVPSDGGPLTLCANAPQEERMLDACHEASAVAAKRLEQPAAGRDPTRGPLAGALGAMHAALPRHEPTRDAREHGGSEPPPLMAGLAGFLSYEAVSLHEPVAPAALALLASPLALLTLYGASLTVDASQRRIWAASLHGPERADELMRRFLAASPGHAPAAPRMAVPLHHHTDRDAYLAGVSRVQAAIREGDVFQANLTLAVSAPAPGPLALYRRLRRINPSPFACFLDPGDPALPLIASSSPERLVAARGLAASARPIAGTRPRGMGPGQERALEEELLASEKERAEHTMLVDLVRNDLGRLAEPGSVRVAEFARIEDYSHVKHLVSSVTGRLGRVADQPSLLASFFPGGTITGAPKVRACQLLAQVEPHTRGPYTGSLGYLSTTGAMDWNILIRTLVVSQGRVYAQAGAGIVADSDPAAEHLESLQKAEALVASVGGTLVG